MPINIVLADVDGCLVKEDKTKPPVLEDLSGSVQQLQTIGDFLRARPQISLSLCTNRSLASGLRIVELVGANAYSAFEGGNVIYNPLSGESYLLVKREPSLRHMEPILDKLQAWYRQIKDSDLVRDLGIAPENLRRLGDRKALLTFEVLPFDAPPVSGYQIWDAIKKRFLTPEISALLDSGYVNVIPSAPALDIGLKIDKSDAVKHILTLHDIARANALGIGDSFHSDLSLLLQTAYQGVPANAGSNLKERVVEMGGYISLHPCSDGVLDILNYFLGDSS